MLKSQNCLNRMDMEIFMFFGLFVFFPSHHMYNNKIVTNYLIIWFDSFSLKSWHLFGFFFFNVKIWVNSTWPIFNLFKVALFYPTRFGSQPEWPNLNPTQLDCLPCLRTVEPQIFHLPNKNRQKGSPGKGSLEGALCH